MRRLRLRVGMMVGVISSVSIVAPFRVDAQMIKLIPVATVAHSRLEGLGALADAVSDGGGHFLLLDGSHSRVLVVDRQLHLVSTFGSKGSGIGQFIQPSAIGLLPDRRVVVLDQRRGQITIFRTRDRGRTFTADTTFRSGGTAEGMCVGRRGDVVVYGAVAGTRLHVVDRSGRILRSFAPGEPGLTPMALDVLTQGRISCSPETDEVLLASKFLPVVESYDIASGRRVWVDTLIPFRSLALRDKDGSVSITSGPGGYSRISTLFEQLGCRVFQTTYDSRQDGATVDTVVTYVYRDTSGKWLSPSIDVPLLFPVGTDEVIVAHPGTDTIELARVDIDGCVSQTRE